MGAVLVVLTTLVAVAVGPVGIAMAEPPTVTIESPLPGSSTNNPMPSFSGTTSDVLDQVTLNIYAGATVEGTPVTLNALPPLLEGKWSLTPTSPLAGGTYTAVATQTNLVVAETGFSEPPVTFTVEAAPVVTTNPVGQTVLAGEGATFVAAASGVPTPEVQWQVSTDGGSTFSNDTTDVGNTTGTLTVTGAVVGQSGYEYRTVFTNGVGLPATSTAATLTVEAAPVVTTNPASKGVVAGKDAVFTAAASGAPTPTVQWQVSTDFGLTWIDDTTDVGNETDTLTVVGVVGESGYEYRAVFTNVAGPPATSAPATLTVDAAPVVTINPVSKSVVVGEGATFVVAASGVPTPTLQWESNSGSGWTAVPGATTDTLTVANTTLSESGYEYRAVFTNTVFGNLVSATSTQATLTVAKKTVAPVITTNPIGQTVLAGEGATFTAAASGIPTPTVQWQVSTDGGATFSDDTTDVGSETGTLTVAGVAGESGQEYRAVFTNAAGPPATSVPAMLTVDEAPVVTTNPDGRTVVVGEGATFVAEASGIPTPTVQWQLSTNRGLAWINDTTDAGNKTDTLTVANAALSESGYEYRAVFTNMVFGHPRPTATSLPATLTVAKKPVAPVVTINPVSKSAVAGKDAIFTAEASGIPTPTVKWQVSTDFGSTWTEDTTDAGNATDTLTVAGALAAESGYEYRAVFTNAAGPPVTSAPASLTVDVAPVIVINPVSESVVAGETATFTAAASGTPTPTLQWQESTSGGAAWTAVPGATADTLTVANTTLAESGQEYRAMFTNTVKTVTTVVATLTVSAPAPELAPAIIPRAPSPPVASFAWFPTAPHSGESVSLASSSTDVSSPITSFAWDTAGNGTFQAGPPVIGTSFSTPGSHVVRLRVTDANGLASVVAETVVVTPPPLTLMQPFPIVRIAGSDTSSGVKLSLLTVQAPLGARVTAQCRGRGCPVKSESQLARSSKNKAGTVLVVFRRLERSLRAGVILSIRVSSAGEIGKYTSFTIRRNKPPVRVDACIGPTNPKPIPCPAS